MPCNVWLDRLELEERSLDIKMVASKIPDDLFEEKYDRK